MIGGLLYTFFLLMLLCLFTRYRIRTLDESIRKLSKYCEAVSLRKQQRNDLLPNEKSVGLNSLKMGTQIHRSSPDLVTQRLEDRTKNVVMNKRVRTSMADVWVCIENFLGYYETFYLIWLNNPSLFHLLGCFSMPWYLVDVIVF